MRPIELARRVLGLLDLTSLEGNETQASIEALCQRARTVVTKDTGESSAGGTAQSAQPPTLYPAAVCVYGAFVGTACEQLRGTPVRVATVANFPAGGEDVALVEREIAQACEAGAHEVDVVLPYHALTRGDLATVKAMLQMARKTAGPATLKVILESGLLSPVDLERACKLSLDEGADFLKTSTGKVPIGATPAAVSTMLSAALAAGRPVGVKVSGGVRSLAHAEGYLEIAERLAGVAWVSSRTFRFGASALFEVLLDELRGRVGSAARTDQGY